MKKIICTGVISILLFPLVFGLFFYEDLNLNIWAQEKNQQKSEAYDVEEVAAGAVAVVGAVEKEEFKTLEMSIVGDVMFGTNFGQIGTWHTYYAKGPAYYFSGVRGIFDEKDLVIGNLENVFTDQGNPLPGKIYTYKGDPKYINVLKESGITHFSVVNNHMQDYGQKGFDDHIRRLNELGFKWFGTNDFLSKSAEMGSIKVDQKQIFEKDGIKIGLLSYYGFYDAYATEVMIKRDIKFLREENKVDYIIACVHWGGQNTSIPTVRQESYGKRLVDLGVDLVIGSHPHALQPREEYKGKYIYYSLGDFLFVDRKIPQTPYSVIVNLNLSKDEKGKIHEEFTHIPVYWSGEKTKNIYQPRIIEDPLEKKEVFKILNVVD